MTYQPKLYACDSSLWSFGYWRDGVWRNGTAMTACSDGLLPKESVFACLRARRVLVFGDSMIRALFTRLVAFLRSQPQYIDHHFRGGAYYMANGTHDVFVEGELLPSLVAAARARQPSLVAPATPEDGWELGASMQVQFYWAPHFGKGLAKDGREAPGIWEQPGASEGADVVIAGAMYMNNTDDFESYRKALLHYFKVVAQQGKRVRQFFWIPTVPKPGEAAELYRERNRKMRGFVALLNDHAGLGDLWAPSISYYVDLERMYQVGFMRPDGVHFHCNKGPMYPMSVTNDLTGIAGNKDCSDPFNLNVIHSILKVSCNF
ncbi:hypothetical protein HXX76_008552 [Chlamydomonas incerta]|uniref:Uncharacterized protein n=1 Tax=Chlamydomonas incerta TaxID=51695 RepID=A0A835STG7_CHLIN|nr:hypothetical protein HXX76_008552 [Chlamydomonas incerta]|eukprot:KAG2432818.1 hypothetical protein HXX76_008552 [Chlamydomonas incerta]